MKRPLQVVIVAWLLVADGASFVAVMSQFMDWRDPSTYVALLVGVGLCTIWIHPLLRRKNWARWVVSVFAVCCCMLNRGGVIQPEFHWPDNKILITIAVLRIGAGFAKVFLLFSKSSDAWFRAGKQVDSEPKV